MLIFFHLCAKKIDLHKNNFISITVLRINTNFRLSCSIFKLWPFITIGVHTLLVCSQKSKGGFQKFFHYDRMKFWPIMTHNDPLWFKMTHLSDTPYCRISLTPYNIFNISMWKFYNISTLTIVLLIPYIFVRPPSPGRGAGVSLLVGSTFRPMWHFSTFYVKIQRKTPIIPNYPLLTFVTRERYG